MKINDLTVVICCSKKDYFFARLCAVSVRYYYPEIEIELVKELQFGNFDTKPLEETFSVKVVNLGVDRFGWSGAKFHYLYKMPKGKSVLLLDADIVFVGPFLERILPVFEQSDYVVSADYTSNAYSDYVKNTYFDVNQLQASYPDYKFPGYFFNAGQIFARVGAIPQTILDEFFDAENYPYWKHQDVFPLVDQSVYNYLLPTLADANKLALGIDKFMIWSLSEKGNAIDIAGVKNKLVNDGLIHWAGDKRTAALHHMTRADILQFFEHLYFTKVGKSQFQYRLYKAAKSLEYNSLLLKRIFRRTAKLVLKPIFKIVGQK